MAPVSNAHRVCAVSTCKNPNGISYHRFPRDPLLIQEWLLSCQWDVRFNIETARVCGNHFAPECFERDLRNELLGLPLRKSLKKTAIPVPKLPVKTDQVCGSEPSATNDSRLERHKKRMNTIFVNQILADADKPSTLAPSAALQSSVPSPEAIEKMKTDLKCAQKDLRISKAKRLRLERRVEKLNAKILTMAEAPKELKVQKQLVAKLESRVNRLVARKKWRAKVKKGKPITTKTKPKPQTEPTQTAIIVEDIDLAMVSATCYEDLLI